MPAVSERQRKAMCAAASGRSTLGISKEVGMEFCGKGKAMKKKAGKKKPMRDRLKAAAAASKKARESYSKGGAY
ncbi:MAG TPA: hypothetical protein VFS92_06390 [Planctomycetota bacterium]|nr:hypothetical protein [Planctomycetota bacterium]